MSTTETIERLVAPLLSALGIELVDVESHPGHLKITIDREPRLDLGALSEATAAVSHALDEADAVPGGRYELEVSSPGVERRLRRPEHFARFVGTEIAVRLRAGVGRDGERRFEGVLTAADETGIVVEVASAGDGPRRLSYDDLERAHTVFDWRAALASAPPAAPRHQRRDARPSAADRSRAAAEARTAPGSALERSRAAAEARTAPGSALERTPATAGAPRARTRSGLAPTETTMADDDRHLTETS
jgi:ribosome maturation factor RimP